MIHRGFAIQVSNQNSSQALAAMVKVVEDNVIGDCVLLMKD